MLMSLLVLRVLYLFFDSAAHALLWMFTRTLRMDRDTARSLLGLDVEASDDKAVPGVEDPRNGSAEGPAPVSQV